MPRYLLIISHTLSAAHNPNLQQSKGVEILATGAAVYRQTTQWHQPLMLMAYTEINTV